MFEFCKQIKFTDLTGFNFYGKPISDNPIDWLNKLKAEGVIQLRARYFGERQKGASDRMERKFEAQWLVESVKANGSDFWDYREKLGDKNDPEKKVWEVYYRRVAKKIKTEDLETCSVNELSAEMKSLLEELHAFANQIGYANFGECFLRGLKALTDEPMIQNKKWRIPPIGFLSKKSEQLLNACISASVFGGMGSWNDIGLSDYSATKKHSDLSRQLSKLINISLMAAINPP